MPIKILTNPAYEPVSLVEAREWCRITAGDTTHDVSLTILRKAMREYAENYTFRAYVSRTYRLILEEWPLDNKYGVRILLPFPPLRSVDAFRYIDTDGDLQTLATDQYAVHDDFEPAFIIPEWSVSWPSIRAVPDALQIDFTAGYASGSPTDEAAAQEVLPGSLRLWMQARIATLFENREQLIIGTTMVKIPHDLADGVLDSLFVGTRIA